MATVLKLNCVVNQSHLQVTVAHKAAQSKLTTQCSLCFSDRRLLNIRSLNYCCLVNASRQLCYKCRLPVFIVGSLVNVRRRLPKNLQMTGMPKSGSSLLATRS